MRIFIGIELPPGVKRALYETSNKLKNDIESAKWVSRDNIHLTLRFLGQVTPEQINELETAIIGKLDRFRKFYFSLDGTGGFPSARRARVLWVGVGHGEEELIRLSQAIEEAVVSLGFEPENKTFTPHITLARLKTPKSIEDALSKLDAVPFAGRLVNVDGVTIFQSTLKPTGAEYKPLRFIALQG